MSWDPLVSDWGLTIIMEFGGVNVAFGEGARGVWRCFRYIGFTITHSTLLALLNKLFSFDVMFQSHPWALYFFSSLRSRSIEMWVFYSRSIDIDKYFWPQKDLFLVIYCLTTFFSGDFFLTFLNALASLDLKLSASQSVSHLFRIFR